MLVYLKGKQVGKPAFIHTDSVIFVVFSLEHNLYPITQIPHYFFPSTPGNSISLSKENEILIQS